MNLDETTKQIADDDPIESVIPNMRDLDHAEEGAESYDPELAAQAEKIATSVLGDSAGSTAITPDIMKMIVDRGPAVVEEFFKTISADVEIVTLNEKQYRLTTLFKLKPKQRKAVYRIAKEVSADAIVDGKLGIAALLESLNDDKANEIFAHLYVPEGTKYNAEKVQTYIADMEDLDLGQQLGAIFRFFTSTGFSIQSGIRTYLIPLINRYIRA